jgi:hypothetical protein
MRRFVSYMDVDSLSRLVLGEINPNTVQAVAQGNGGGGGSGVEADAGADADAEAEQEGDAAPANGANAAAATTASSDALPEGMQLVGTVIWHTSLQGITSLLYQTAQKSLVDVYLLDKKNVHSMSNMCRFHHGIRACILQLNDLCLKAGSASSLDGMLFSAQNTHIPAFKFAKLGRVMVGSVDSSNAGASEMPANHVNGQPGGYQVLCTLYFALGNAVCQVIKVITLFSSVIKKIISISLSLSLYPCLSLISISLSLNLSLHVYH